MEKTTDTNLSIHESIASTVSRTGEYYLAMLPPCSNVLK